MEIPLKEGWLTKQGGLIKTWKKRWFTLEQNVLVYSKMPGLEKKGQIVIKKDTDISLVPDYKKPNCFLIDPKIGRIYYIQANSQQEASEWVRILRDISQGRSSVDLFRMIPTALPKRFIAKTALGCVYSIIDSKTKREFAIKAIPKAAIYGERSGDLKPFTTQDPPIVISPLMIVESQQKVLLVSEYIPGITLMSKVENEGRIAEPLAKKYLIEMISSLMIHHKYARYYGDFNPSNVIIDFNGHARLCPPTNMKYINGNHRFMHYSEHNVLLGQEPRPSSDIWSLGIVYYFMLCGCPPFYDSDFEILKEIIKEKKVLYPPFISMKARNIIDFMFLISTTSYNENSIKNHPYFEGTNWSMVENLQYEPQWAPKAHPSIPNNLDSTLLFGESSFVWKVYGGF